MTHPRPDIMYPGLATDHGPRTTTRDEQVSEPNAGQAETLVYSVSTGQKVGDVFLLTLLTPIFFVMLGLLVAIPVAAVIYGAGLGSDDTARARMLLGAAAAGALPLTLLALRGQICWRITLLPDRLQLGSGPLGRDVSYDQVRLVRAGEHVPARARRARAAVPLLIELASRPRRCRIWLSRADASDALMALHRRADAPAVDLKGRDLLPRDPQRRAAGAARLVRLHRAVGLALVVIGLALLGLLLSVGIGNLRRGGFWSDLGDMIEVGGAGAAMLLAGLAALRRARRVARRGQASGAAETKRAGGARG